MVLVNNILVLFSNFSLFDLLTFEQNDLFYLFLELAASFAENNLVL